MLIDDGGSYTRLSNIYSNTFKSPLNIPLDFFNINMTVNLRPRQGFLAIARFILYLVQPHSCANQLNACFLPRTIRSDSDNKETLANLILEQKS